MANFFNKAVLFCCVLLGTGNLFAQTQGSSPSTTTQEVCGATLVHEELLQKDKDYRSRIKSNEAQLQELIEQKAYMRTSQTANAVYVIPVVVHIVHTGEAVGTGNNISDAQVQSAITALNDMYRKKAGTYGDGGGVDMQVEFQLAVRDPYCNPTTGIVRVNGSSVANYAAQGVKAASAGADEKAVKNLSRWPNSDYYNIWVVNEIDDNNGGAGIQGYAYFPGAPATVDGTIILNSAFGTTGTAKSYTNRGHTLAHELGHGFNLYHTFEGDGTGSSCPPVTNGCGSGQGDCVADTEPHKRSQSNCPTGTLNSCTGSTIGNVYKNFMDYSSQYCANEFTQGQKDRLRSAITTLRPGLLNSLALTQSPVATPVASLCVPSGTVAYNNYGMGIYSVGVGSSAVNSDGTVNDNAVRVDRSCSQQFSVNQNEPISLSVATGPSNNENVRIYIDYNNNGSFNDPGEMVFTSSAARSHTGSIVPAASAATNVPLRMRVISDWASNSISGSCYVPDYGQIEEFAFKIISPLPVSLTSFTVQKLDRQVILDWATAQELNNSYFEIERADGSLDNWQKVGRVPGHGTTSQPQDYTFTDVQPLKGDNYYRLKQVDSDGKFEYSPVRHAAFTDEFVNIVVYPNPSQGLFVLELPEQTESTCSIRVYNMSGQLVYQQQIGQMRQHELSLQQQPNGIYVLEVENGSKLERVKLVKQ
ncbi:MAG: zinc-dependent metalloprotease [Hymenobacteraceae bacterium]|nr:zinc-dependent metalloprotease [Hymenobacteraceae bacterium]MDX5394990.1 zinc-dependent metalloprotease [Hymenobacteraceae bacterium]MDX5511023.1 zinc-dependent metalloprotease [Hymenobacteraceae bacterium]